MNYYVGKKNIVIRIIMYISLKFIFYYFFSKNILIICLSSWSNTEKYIYRKIYWYCELKCKLMNLSPDRIGTTTARQSSLVVEPRGLIDVNLTSRLASPMCIFLHSRPQQVLYLSYPSKRVGRKGWVVLILLHAEFDLHGHLTKDHLQ